MLTKEAQELAERFENQKQTRLGAIEVLVEDL